MSCAPAGTATPTYPGASISGFTGTPSTVAVHLGSNETFTRTTAARVASTRPEKSPSAGDAVELTTVPGTVAGSWSFRRVGAAAGRPPKATVGNILLEMRPELRKDDICWPMFVRFAAIGAIVSTTSRYPMSSTRESEYNPCLATSVAGIDGLAGDRVMMYLAPNRS